jgi:tetratricopeptide (TPR) repeat protein
LQLNRWQEADTMLRPYVGSEARLSLPTSTQHRLCLLLAMLRTEQGRFDEAVHLARQALHLAQLHNERREEGAARHALGKIYRLLGQPAIAREHYKIALQLHRDLGDGVRLAASCFGLSVIAAGKSDYTTAQQHLARAFPLVTEADDPLLYGHLCNLQASVLVLAENSRVAERLPWFERAYAAFETIGQTRFLARTLNNWGHQLWLIGHWQEAQERLEQALKLGRDVQDRSTIASALESLGELHGLHGNYSVSHGLLAEALAQVAGYDRFVEGQVLLATARVLQWQGQYDSARTRLEQVMQLAAQTEAHAQHLNARLQRADLACTEGEWALVEPMVLELQPEVERLKSLELMGRLRWLEGLLARQQNNLKLACTRLEQAHTHFAVTEQPFWLGRTSFALAQVYAQQGEAERAAQFAHKAQQQFQLLAAHFFEQTVTRWMQAQPQESPSSSSPMMMVTAPTTTDALTRLLEAANARAVLARELVAILHQQLPHTTVIAYVSLAR